MSTKSYPPLQFSGTKQKRNVQVIRNKETETLNNYIPDPELVKAVNLALLLEMPLLVMGEPGCGKSLLARAIAFDLYQENLYTYYREWHIKSTSKAKEGLYEFDYVHRLRDATLPKLANDNPQASKNQKTATEKQTTNDIQNVDKYIHFGKMGEAFTISKKADERAVLLIDEIDKADIDFPNDLLNELDKMEFEIHEKKIEQDELERNSKGKKRSLGGIPVNVKAEFRPVVIITSNSEKELPDAFLRRCIFHYIEPLPDTRLKEIVLNRYYDNVETDPLIDKAIGVFVNLRETIKNELLSLGKNVSTSEFINWFEALKHYSELSSGKKTADTLLKDLVDDVSRLNPDDMARIPLKNILLKNVNSVIRFNEKQGKS